MNRNKVCPRNSRALFYPKIRENLDNLKLTIRRNAETWLRHRNQAKRKNVNIFREPKINKFLVSLVTKNYFIHCIPVSSFRQ